MRDCSKIKFYKNKTGDPAFEFRQPSLPPVTTLVHSWCLVRNCQTNV